MSLATDAVLVLSLSSLHLPLQFSHLYAAAFCSGLSGGLKHCKSLARYQRPSWVVNLGPGRTSGWKKKTSPRLSSLLMQYWAKPETAWATSQFSQPGYTQHSSNACFMKLYPENAWEVMGKSSLVAIVKGLCLQLMKQLYSAFIHF